MQERDLCRGVKEVITDVENILGEGGISVQLPVPLHLYFTSCV